MSGLFAAQRNGGNAVFDGIGDAGTLLTGDNVTQVNASSSGSIGQTHILYGDNSTQVNTSSAGSIVDNPAYLNGLFISQRIGSSAVFDGIGNNLVLGGDDSTQNNTTSSGSITQEHILAGGNVTQPNTSSSGAISDGSPGSNCAQQNTSTSGAISTMVVLPWFGGVSSRHSRSKKEERVEEIIERAVATVDKSIPINNEWLRSVAMETPLSKALRAVKSNIKKQIKEYEDELNDEEDIAALFTIM